MTAKILVVEDEAVIARDIRGTLKALGYEVGVPVASGAKALEAVASRSPDLVLMDIRIRGDMDGIDTAAKIREHHGTPVVYLTSHSDEATVARAKGTGPYGYLLKPFSDRELHVAIEIALQRRELEKLALESEHQKAQSRHRIASRDLETLTHSLAHDLRTPLRAIRGFSEVLIEGYKDKLDASGFDCLGEIRSGANRMAEVIDAMLAISQVTRSELRPSSIDLSSLAREAAGALARGAPTRVVDLVVVDGLRAELDPALARLLVEGLVGNAWKFTARSAHARIELGVTGEESGAVVFFIRDNGAGFDMAYVEKLFVPFQSLHAPGEFPGVKIGLAMARRIVDRHGGRIWAEGAVDRGATFFVSLPHVTLDRRAP